MGLTLLHRAVLVTRIFCSLDARSFASRLGRERVGSEWRIEDRGWDASCGVGFRYVPSVFRVRYMMPSSLNFFREIYLLHRGRACSRT